MIGNLRAATVVIFHHRWDLLPSNTGSVAVVSSCFTSISVPSEVIEILIGSTAVHSTSTPEPTCFKVTVRYAWGVSLVESLQQNPAHCYSRPAAPDVFSRPPSSPTRNDPYLSDSHSLPFRFVQIFPGLYK